MEMKIITKFVLKLIWFWSRIGLKYHKYEHKKLILKPGRNLFFFYVYPQFRVITTYTHNLPPNQKPTTWQKSGGIKCSNSHTGQEPYRPSAEDLQIAKTSGPIINTPGLVSCKFFWDFSYNGGLNRTVGGLEGRNNLPLPAPSPILKSYIPIDSASSTDNISAKIFWRSRSVRALGRLKVLAKIFLSNVFY